MKKTRSQLGRRSRTKGASFERDVKNALRLHLAPHYPSVNVRRALQAEQAHEPDVVIEGHDVPQGTQDLWFECNHANMPNPTAKLTQATRDARLASTRTGRNRVPIVVWRKTKCRVDNATMTLAQLITLTTGEPHGTYAGVCDTIEVTLPFDHLLALLVPA